VTVEDLPEEPGLLGLYSGIPLTEREAYGGMAMPDRITLYRIPICAMCRSEDDVVEVVRDTVIHEVAHHFGIDDERLDELGWA
jgi:predicted Zn-dependent protease with MMP-like domain